MCRGFQSGRHRSDGFCENGLTWARLKAAPRDSTLSHPVRLYGTTTMANIEKDEQGGREEPGVGQGGLKIV